MPRIHLIEGPVGAGKSTLGRELTARHAAPALVLDDWMATLFGPDRPSASAPTRERVRWYMERKERCLDQIWKVASGLLDAGSDVVLELGLVQAHARQSFYGRVDAAARELAVYVLDAPREVRRARVRARNQARGETWSMDVPDAFFDHASDLWEAPDATECADRDVQFVNPPARVAGFGPAR